MLLAVGIIAASAFIQNHECWSQVRTTEQGQHDQNLIESIPCQLKEHRIVCRREVPGPMN